MQGLLPFAFFFLLHVISVNSEARVFDVSHFSSYIKKLIQDEHADRLTTHVSEAATTNSARGFLYADSVANSIRKGRSRQNAHMHMAPRSARSELAHERMEQIRTTAGAGTPAVSLLEGRMGVGAKATWSYDSVEEKCKRIINLWTSQCTSQTMRPEGTSPDAAAESKE